MRFVPILRFYRMRSIRTAPFFFLVPLLVVGQTFEVASIKPSAPIPQMQTSAGTSSDAAMVRYSALSLKRYLGMAYGLKNYEISAPDWMASENWDIAAKLPEGASSKQIPEMLAALLRDRFQIRMHRETKDLPVYGLIAGNRGLTIKESPEPVGESVGQNSTVRVTGSGGRITVTYGDDSYRTIGDNKIEGKKLSMAIIADTLAQYADRPVLDITGLKGRYDFIMEFAPEDFRVMVLRASIANGVTLPPDALRLIDGAPADTL